MAFCCTACLAWSAAWLEASASVLRSSTSRSTVTSWVAIVSAARVSSRVRGRVAPLVGVVGHEHRLAGLAVELLQLLQAPVQAQLGLTLVGDDVGGLLLEAQVLVLRLADRLLELDLGVGPLVERSGQLGGQVLPPAAHQLEHGDRVYRAGSGAGPGRPPVRRVPVGLGRGPAPADAVARLLQREAQRLELLDHVVDVVAQAGQGGWRRRRRPPTARRRGRRPRPSGPAAAAGGPRPAWSPRRGGGPSRAGLRGTARCGSRCRRCESGSAAAVLRLQGRWRRRGGAPGRGRRCGAGRRAATGPAGRSPRPPAPPRSIRRAISPRRSRSGPGADVADAPRRGGPGPGGRPARSAARAR